MTTIQRKIKWKVQKQKKNKKNRYCNEYSSAYENDPVFKGWIKASTKCDLYAYCIPCDKHLNLTAGKKKILRGIRMQLKKFRVIGPLLTYSALK